MEFIFAVTIDLEFSVEAIVVSRSVNSFTIWTMFID